MYGRNLQTEIFGASHADEIGVIINGLPAGEKVDLLSLLRFMGRRRPGRSPYSSARLESDYPEITAGLDDDWVTTGDPLCGVIRNGDIRTKDYINLGDAPRPGHADYTAYVKWKGSADMRGGGKFSGRMTAPMCIAGGIAMQILARRGVYVGAHVSSVGDIEDYAFPMMPGKEVFDYVADKRFPVLDDRAGKKMQQLIADVSAEGDSIGGTIECAAIGVPEGLGDAMFDGAESRIAAAVFGIPAVKGVEFGAGFGAAKMRGSRNNDAFCVREGKIMTETNNCGGILGGITDGMPIRLCAAIKPTPSISKLQKTVSLSGLSEKEIRISGRHDPCIAPRAVPVVEAVVALALLDIMLDGQDAY